MARTTGRVPPGVAASFQESSDRRSSGSAVRKPASTWLSVSEETKIPYDEHTSEKRTSPRYLATSGSRGKGCTWYTQAGWTSDPARSDPITARQEPRFRDKMA